MAFSEIDNFKMLTENWDAIQIFQTLNIIYKLFDDRIDKYDVYKVYRTKRSIGNQPFDFITFVFVTVHGIELCLFFANASAEIRT